MIEDYDSSVDTNPFWFVSSELLAEVFRTEIKAIAQLFSTYPGLRKFLDSPEATIPQRTTCFELLVHRRIIETIDETLVARYEKPLIFTEEESRAVSMSTSLVTSDAPAWVLEMNEVANWLPTRIHTTLPETLRNEVLCAIDPAKKEAACRLAAETLGTIEQIQALIARVSDQQLQRLKERWSATVGQPGGPKKPKHWLKGFKGLGPKVADLSRYMENMTDKQQAAFSLKYEYELGPVEIASRMGIDRSTMYEHIEAANKKVAQIRSLEKSKINRAKSTPE